MPAESQTELIQTQTVTPTENISGEHEENKLEIPLTQPSENNAQNETNKPKKVRKPRKSKLPKSPNSVKVSSKGGRTNYITKSTTELPPGRFDNQNHLPFYLSRDKRKTCYLCRYKTKKLDMKSLQYMKTSWTCEYCQVPLCIEGHRNCFYEYHKNHEL